MAGSFLFRLRSKLKSKVQQRLEDGSALVEVELFDGQRMQVRQIEGRILTRQGKWGPVRLWTSRLDARKYSAAELLELQARRWESETAFDELKKYKVPEKK